MKAFFRSSWWLGCLSLGHQQQQQQQQEQAASSNRITLQAAAAVAAVALPAKAEVIPRIEAGARHRCRHAAQHPPALQSETYGRKIWNAMFFSQLWNYSHDIA